jgi:hypothetical protein
MTLVQFDDNVTPQFEEEVYIVAKASGADHIAKVTV